MSLGRSRIRCAAHMQSGILTRKEFNVLFIRGRIPGPAIAHSFVADFWHFACPNLQPVFSGPEKLLPSHIQWIFGSVPFRQDPLCLYPTDSSALQQLFFVRVPATAHTPPFPRRSICRALLRSARLRCNAIAVLLMTS